MLTSAFCGDTRYMTDGSPNTDVCTNHLMDTFHVSFRRQQRMTAPMVLAQLINTTEMQLQSIKLFFIINFRFFMLNISVVMLNVRVECNSNNY